MAILLAMKVAYRSVLKPVISQLYNFVIYCIFCNYYMYLFIYFYYYCIVYDVRVTIKGVGYHVTSDLLAALEKWAIKIQTPQVC